jgi:poly(3-hydroxybutyrate) depolymerase
MSRPDPRLVESGPLPYLLSLPVHAAGAPPLLCFLHGYDEGAPMPVQQALTRHGPLAASASPRAAEFIVVAPQMPARGDLWHRHVDAVRDIVRQVQAEHAADAERTYLTGFSFGGNGVFDLALAQRDLWAALWPVDPTRVPRLDPGLPVWLSSGEISRHAARAFTERLRLEPLEGGEPGDRVYVDQAQDHVGTARMAFRDERIYAWLHTRRRQGSGA